MKRAACLLLCLVMAALLCVGALADGYTYTVRIYAGSQGTINGQSEYVLSGLQYGQRVTFDLNSVSLGNDSKYYVRGIRESGGDNSTVGTPSFVVTQDRDYVVAYGIRGSVVVYTVQFVDEEGNVLAESEVYYGNSGDKPVIAYRYIEGYQPLYYNITGTLSDDASQNVFAFVYRNLSAAADEAAGTTTTTATLTGEDGVGGENSGVEREEAAALEPEEILDLDVPLANAATADGGIFDEGFWKFLDENGIGIVFRSTLLGILWARMTRSQRYAFVVISAMVAGGLIWLLVVLRKKKDEPDENDEYYELLHEIDDDNA